ncbi:hypothetical protein GRS48_06585 [Halorubrum sp. JWXQ-INN 858]|uniref:hypothetical protein n=1 Tax=Halorubrum sp. JWXQ-INN 858 TaxID=2690782 RepID=UPI00135959CE|nr:hypothetical protein [Halorubrum sp. JWXQ-INN 858]MWV64491.1 hypothetical protein [Halorubrum sp. JWXQ-INN 858]
MPPNTADNDSREQAELNNVEVVEDSPNVSKEMEALSTFTETEGPFSYKLLPVIKGGSTNWRIIVYMTGVQGPVYESDQRVTDDAADELGMSRKLQDRLNNALEHANNELEIPPGLGDQKRQKRSLHELEVMME